MIGKISGTGSYVPSRYLDNHNLSQIVDTSDEWIQERTGIIRRHIVEADTTVSMAAQAAEKALESAKMLPEEIDLLIVSTISSNVILPCTACEVQIPHAKCRQFQKNIKLSDLTCPQFLPHISVNIS